MTVVSTVEVVSTAGADPESSGTLGASVGSPQFNPPSVEVASPGVLPFTDGLEFSTQAVREERQRARATRRWVGIGG